MPERSGGRVVGQTRDTGFQVGMRRTLPIGLAEAWRLITSLAGVRAWLGDGGRVAWEPGHAYTLADGSTGEVRVVQPESHVRLTWQPKGWPRASTIQVRVIPAAAGTTVSFHQEHMPSAAACQERRAHFAAAHEALERLAAAS